MVSVFIPELDLQIVAKIKTHSLHSLPVVVGLALGNFCTSIVDENFMVVVEEVTLAV